MNSAASLSWFARHELNLAWRDWAALMSGGRKRTNKTILIGMAIFALALHGLAYALLSSYVGADLPINKTVLVTVSGSLLLTFTMMLSQAMESVTRAFYSRDDLDLILSSPASSRDLFAVRIGMVALTTAMMSGLIVAPFINVAAGLGGVQWLAGYLIILALSAIATGCAVLIALGLFKTVGPKRTRLFAQIGAAIVGASFLIGIQVVAIVSYGTMSRWSVMNSKFVMENSPSIDSLVWLPALGVTGNIPAVLFMLTLASAFFVYAVVQGAVQFRQNVLAALEVSNENVRRQNKPSSFAQLSTHSLLMHKEWKLLGRDPWLISQTLMQILYLIPPAVMLWVNFGADAEMSAIISPVVVMAIGQLAGGLAWLTISGEDAPDLLETAPMTTHSLTWAKINAVLVIVAVLTLPLVLAMAIMSIWGAFVTLVGALVAALCAIIIQLLFRTRAKRSNFRRRQVASKASTFCEAFASILCAGTAGLTVVGTWLALIPAVLAAGVIAIAWLISPSRQ